MGFQSELDTGTVLIDREELAALRAQLLDAKRNERAVGENGELKARVVVLDSSNNAIRAHCDLKSVPYSECHLCGRIELNPHPAYECPRCEVKEERAADEARLDAAEAKLHTLEAEALDTQRNEERAAAEIAEVEMKLHTLEAAVRAVRDVDGFGDGFGDNRGLDMDFRPLDKLYDLVPDGSEGGS